MDYLDQQHLIGVEMYDGGFEQGESGEEGGKYTCSAEAELIPPGVAPSAHAPKSFAAAPGKGRGAGLPRSPTKAGAK